jgi:hypothetical protein
MLQKSLTKDNLSHIYPMFTSIEAWYNLNHLFIINKRIQLSKYDVVQEECDDYVGKEDDTPESLFRRITHVVVMRYHGSLDIWMK